MKHYTIYLPFFSFQVCNGFVDLPFVKRASFLNNWSFNLFICLFIYLFIYLFICLFIYLFIYFFIQHLSKRISKWIIYLLEYNFCNKIYIMSEE